MSGVSPIGQRFDNDVFQDQAAYDGLIAARVRMIRECPFWGVLAMGLILVEDTSGSTKTLGVDGMHMFYSAEFVKKLNRDETMFVYAHEAYHCLYRHIGWGSHRGEGKIPDLWNRATDYVVNGDLIDGKIGTPVSPEIIKILYDPMFKGWSSEKVYEYLKENPIHPSHALLDDHLDVKVGEEGEEKTTPRQGEKEITITRGEEKRLNETWNALARQAITTQMDMENRGLAGQTVTKAVKQLIQNLVVPVVDWRQMLRRFIVNVLRRSFSYARPNRSLFNQGITIPGFRSRTAKLEIAVAVDCSGSITNHMLHVFLSELKGILDSFTNYEITAWCFEGDVIEDSVTTITRTSKSSLNDLKPFLKRIKGGGGTVFESNWSWMKRNNVKPKLLLMFTDGHPNAGWGDHRYCPTMFLIVPHNKAKRITAPFGTTAHYEDYL